jgi:predicted nucleic acid-binding protein
MGINYLIDTNIIIYVLKEDIPEGKVEQITQIIDNSLKISAISKVETLGWVKLTEEDRIITEEFIKQAKVFAITDKIIELAIKIRQNNNLKTPDAIIAATALHNNLTLLTRNDKDFAKINGLNIYNPYE